MPIAQYAILLLLAACAGQQQDTRGGVATLSIIATNDVHGQLMPAPERGGLVTVSGYVGALRSAGGGRAVLLLDAGDMWQGTLESNVTEGAVVVDAYNAMGYAAAAVGNHEFDFGPAGPAATPAAAGDDPRGALKQRAAEAQFPLLAANLIDTATGEPVDWQNVVPSVVVDVGGVRVGIVGVMSANALQATIAANVRGLRIAPLAASISSEAQKLRLAGSDLVVVVAHAGGRCRDYADAEDTSSCDLSGEIFQVAAALPPGLVDHIAAGHVHDGIAHVVNDVAITSAWSRAHAFSRVDFTLDAQSGAVLERHVFPPQIACPYEDVSSGDCAWEQRAGTSPATYEGEAVTPDATVVGIAGSAAQRAERQKARPLGTHLETPLTLEGNPESPLGNLMTDAMLGSFEGDVAIHNVSGGIRAILPAGELTFGDVYEMFPFDNQVVILELSGRDLRRIIAAQARKSRRRAGFSGMTVDVDCDAGGMRVHMHLDGGDVIDDDDSVRVIVNDFLALGGDDILTPAMPAAGFEYDDDLPLARDALVAWLSDRGSLSAEDFDSGERPKWRVPPELPENCRFDG